jgi:peptide/nickel transport system ATP-binding protein
MDKNSAKARALELLHAVGIPTLNPGSTNTLLTLRRNAPAIVIAIALASDPEILICDEPTTALDFTIQAKILDLIKEIKAQRKLSIIFITHDLGVVANMADRIAVMYAGKIVEMGTSEDIFNRPAHPITWALLSSIPIWTPKKSSRRFPGSPPNMSRAAEGNAFAVRNKYALEIDFERSLPCSASPIPTARLLAVAPQRPKVEMPEILADRIRRYAGGETCQCPLKMPPDTEVKNLSMHFTSKRRRRATVVKAVDDVSFAIHKGETFGLVGESGCGRPLWANHHPSLQSDVGHRGVRGPRDIGQDYKRAQEVPHQQYAMIFQDPIASLNPRMTVQEIIGEGLIIRGLKDSKERESRVKLMLEKVGLQAEHAARYPHEFSGGQRQRIGIARALIVEPKMIIADEPVSALDVSVQAQVINLLNSLKREFGLTVLFIAHNLSVVKYFSDRIAVMYRGKLVEMAPSDDIYHCPLHPYTKALLSAVPQPDPHTERSRRRIYYEHTEPKPGRWRCGKLCQGTMSIVRKRSSSQPPAVSSFIEGARY